MFKGRQSNLLQRGSSVVEYTALLSVLALAVIFPAMQLGHEVSASFLQSVAMAGDQNSSTFFQTALGPEAGKHIGGGTESGTKNTTELK